MAYWTKDIFDFLDADKKSVPKYNEDDQFHYGLPNIIGAIIFLVVGLFVSLIILILEIFYHRIKKNNNVKQ